MKKTWTKKSHVYKSAARLVLGFLLVLGVESLDTFVLKFVVQVQKLFEV